MVRRGDGGQGCGAHWVCFRRTLPGWWNGRHGALKMLCPKGRAGSSPALGTKTWVRDLRRRGAGTFVVPACPPVVHIGRGFRPPERRQGAPWRASEDSHLPCMTRGLGRHHPPWKGRMTTAQPTREAVEGSLRCVVPARRRGPDR